MILAWHGSYQRDDMLGIYIGQLREFVVCQALLEGKEARVDVVSIQLPKCVPNTLAVLGSDGSHRHGGPILKGVRHCVFSDIDHDE